MSLPLVTAPSTSLIPAENTICPLFTSPEETIRVPCPAILPSPVLVSPLNSTVPPFTRLIRPLFVFVADVNSSLSDPLARTSPSPNELNSVALMRPSPVTSLLLVNCPPLICDSDPSS